MESGLMYPVYQNQGQGPITHEVKFLDKFYVAMLPCPTVMYLVSMNLKYFNTVGNSLSSDSTAVGL